MSQGHKFGGDWTAKKLDRVKKYLKAYATMMNKQQFIFAYIDAFAGTGYREEKKEFDESQMVFFQQDDIADIEKYSEGSARVALQIKPEFNKYIFIEKSKKHFIELLKLKEEFPDKLKRMELVNANANSYLLDLCRNFKWQNRRAVMFLDPYGMQVEWETIKAIADTEAIDLWYLFPLGIGINRLLKKKVDEIPSAWAIKLDDILGTTEWRSVFYCKKTEETLFGTEINFVKDTNFNEISNFLVHRLKSIFPGVAENPLLLHNSRNNPLYLLCFAAGNPKGSVTAVKIAQDVLKKR
ncbi:MAG: three-Cys-motif partner protein TcmP [Candidatus Omnitrophica bacterium]|nr:three-Cys-motif partner protein TcmP [Candidatus Omnitrophota bacterium]MCK4423428.1 three-Cys-motif partner protein TcmP [Candidatus Omnitrophota bacterium]